MSDDEKNLHDQRDEDEAPESLAPFDSGAIIPPEEAARWQRPADRFPALPNEAPQTVPLKEPPRRRRVPVADPRIGARNRVRNLVALFFVLASCGVLTYFAYIWGNPYSALNPLAPPTPFPLIITATYTPTFTPTPSPTFTPSLTYTPSPLPTIAPTFTFTPIFLEGFSTPQGTPAADQGDFPFTLQHDRILYITNPSSRGGCNWSSIAGSVMNYGGGALDGYGVHVVGEGVDQTVSTGSAPGMGPGGFEVPLGNVARAAQFVAQLLDPQGQPISPVYTVNTLADCDFNIAALRFVEVAPPS